MQLPFGLSAYSRFNGKMPPVRLLNRYAEGSPTSDTGVILYPRPGLTELYDRECRGFYKQDGVYSGDLFSITGTDLYRGASIIGVVFGSDRARFTYTTDGLFILSGGVVYQYTGTLAATDFPDGASVSSLTQIDNFLVATRADTGTIYYRVPGDTTWNALDFFSAEREPDPAIAVYALTDILYVFGTSSIEPFAPIGDVERPFQRLQGASFARGCKDRDSIALLDNTLFFVGEDNKAYRIESVPKRISDHGQEEKIRASSTAKAGAFSWDGHDFYVLQLDDMTLAYDVSSGGWSEFQQGASPFPSLILYDGETAYVGGDKIYTLTDRADDDGEEMQRVFTSVVPTEKPIQCDAIEVTLSPGVTAIGSEPAILETRISRDQGRSWGDWRQQSTGFGGEYRKRVRWRRWGMIDAPGAVFEHRESAAVNIRVSGVEFNPSLGGRSRG